MIMTKDLDTQFDYQGGSVGFPYNPYKIKSFLVRSWMSPGKIPYNYLFLNLWIFSKAYLEPNKTCKMECFTKIINGFRPLTPAEKAPSLKVLNIYLPKTVTRN